MAAHGIEVVVGAAVRGAPVLCRAFDQRIEGRLAGRLGSDPARRFLHGQTCPSTSRKSTEEPGRENRAAFVFRAEW